MSIKDLTRREFLRIAALGGAGMVTAACVPTAAPTAPPAPTTAAAVPTAPVPSVATKAPSSVPQRQVVIGYALQPSSVDPQFNAVTQTVNMADCHFDPLVRKDPDLKIVPALAESWEIVDAKTYVFKLRKGARFHNGEEVKASDVKFTIGRGSKFSSMKRYTELVEKVDVIDDYTVRLNLKTAYAPFLNRVPTFYIVPEKYATATGDAEFAKKPIGSGPYKFVEWVKDDHLTMEANEDYWGGAPKLKRVVFKFIPEPSTRVAALLAGEVDIAESVSPEDIDRLKQAPNVRVDDTVDSYGGMFFAMNSTKPPFNDVRLRQAVSYAINWDEIMKLFGGLAYSRPLPGYRLDYAYEEISSHLSKYAYKHDPDKARKLLSDGGYKDGFEVTIESGRGSWPKDVEVCQIVAAQLQKVGLKAQTKSYEGLVYDNDIYRKGNLAGMGIYTLGNPISDPDHWMSTHFDPARASFPYYVNPKVVELSAKGLATVNKDERVKIYSEAFQIILEEAAYAFGYGMKQIYGIRNDIKWKPRVDVRVYPHEMSFA